MRFIPALTIAIALSTPAYARDISEAELGSLKAGMAEFIDSLQSGDVERTTHTIPPSILAEIAAQSGATVDQLREQMIAGMKAALKGVTFSDVQATFDGLDVQSGESRDGQQVLYTLVPTEMKMSKDDARFLISSTVLALQENGTWYFLRVEGEGQKAVLRAVYPFFEEVEFPAGSMTQTN